jgi:hypothetical protein
MQLFIIEKFTDSEVPQNLTIAKGKGIIRFGGVANDKRHGESF